MDVPRESRPRCRPCSPGPAPSLTALTAVIAIVLAAGALFPTNAAAAPTAAVATGPPTVQTVSGTTDLTGIACAGTGCLAVGNSAHGAGGLAVTGVPATRLIGAASLLLLAGALVLMLARDSSAATRRRGVAP